jgi:hypothetical protein
VVYEADGFLLKCFVRRCQRCRAEWAADACAALGGGLLLQEHQRDTKRNETRSAISLACAISLALPAEMEASCSSFVTDFLNESSTPTSAWWREREGSSRLKGKCV